MKVFILFYQLRQELFKFSLDPSYISYLDPINHSRIMSDPPRFISYHAGNDDDNDDDDEEEEEEG